MSTKKRAPACGEQRYVKVGTHSGDRLYVRRCRSARGRGLVVGSLVETKVDRQRFTPWLGPLSIWKIGDAPEHRLYLEWM